MLFAQPERNDAVYGAKLKKDIFKEVGRQNKEGTRDSTVLYGPSELTQLCPQIPQKGFHKYLGWDTRNEG